EADPLARRGQQRLELILDERDHLAGHFLIVIRLPHPAYDLLCRKGADVGQVQAFLQLVEELLIDPALEAEKLSDAAEQAARLGQALLDLAEDGLKDHFAKLPILKTQITNEIQTPNLKSQTIPIHSVQIPNRRRLTLGIEICLGFGFC